MPAMHNAVDPVMNACDGHVYEYPNLLTGHSL